MTESEPFKQCTLCTMTWQELQDFVADRQLLVEGYLAAFNDPEAGLVLVTHQRQGCGTTLAIPAGNLKPLYDGPEYVEHKTGTEECHHLCLKREELAACEVDCDMAWVRAIIQVLLRHELPPPTAPA